MKDLSEGEYENQVLTQLYSRKATRKAFQMIFSDYKKATGGDLCSVIAKAQKDIMRKTAEDFKTGKNLGTSLRTDAFKMIDYSTWLRYCPVTSTRTGITTTSKVRRKLKVDMV